MKFLRAFALTLLVSPLFAQTPLPQNAALLTPLTQFLGSSGSPLAGGKVYTYAAGTSTLQATYTDSTAGTANANPVVLDSAGRGAIWLGASKSYKVVVQDYAGVQQWTADNVNEPSLYYAAQLQTYVSSLGTSTSVTYTAPYTGAVSRTVNAKLAEAISVKDFGAVGDGVTDDSVAIKAAIARNAGAVRFPAGTYYVAAPPLVVPKPITLIGEGAYISTIKCNVSTGSTKACIVFAGVDTSNRISGGMMDLRILGPNFNDGSPSKTSYVSGSIGLYFGGDPAAVLSPSTYGANFLTVSRAMVEGFDSGVTFGNNAYILNFTDFQSRWNNNGVYYPGAVTNTGELLQFQGGCICDNNAGIYAQNQFGEFYLNSVSVDYNQQDSNNYVGGAFVGSSGIFMNAVNCHIEQFYGPVLKSTPGATYFNIEGGAVDLTGTSGTLPNADAANVFYVSDAANQQQITLRDFQFGLHYAPSVFMSLSGAATASNQSYVMLSSIKGNYNGLTTAPNMVMLYNPQTIPAIVDYGFGFSTQHAANQRYSNIPLATDVLPPVGGTNREEAEMQSGGVKRYAWTLNGQESGSNSGSNLVLSGYDDTGTFLENLLTFSRAAGGTVTAGAPLGSTAGYYSQLPAPSGSNQTHFTFQSGTANRWATVLANAESGSNTGSDWVLSAYTDGGSYLGDAVRFKRSTQLATFPGDINMPLSTPATSSATCTTGTMWADANYVYVCTSTNTIKRAALVSF
jgi:hypothetical protein